MNPYKLLGVEKSAEASAIKTAYKKLALKYHPDKVPEEERSQATEKFKEISEAYSILSNEKRRKFFDKHGTMEGEEDLVDMDDIFKDLFGGSSFGGGSSFMSFEMDDFDDFVSMLEGSSSDAKSFKKLFRDLGRGYKIPGGHK
jgi:DnaJ-class molecular chaperone